MQHSQCCTTSPGWASDALDLYLEGYSQSDIGKIMNITPGSVGNAVAKEALFRLMAAKQAERLEQLIDPEHKNG